MRGSSLASGQNLKITTCATNDDIKKQPGAKQHAQQSAHNAHMCILGVTKSQTFDRRTSREEEKVWWTKEGSFYWWNRLVVTIIPIWLSEDSLRLISGHQTPTVIPDSWVVEKEKVQFNRFTARQNWVACGFLTKSFLSSSLYISSFTSMSSNESVTRPLPVTPVAAATWQISEHYDESLALMWYMGSLSLMKPYTLIHCILHTVPQTCVSLHFWKC